jgi:DNA-binding FrmR family transcriptional regulator
MNSARPIKSEEEFKEILKQIFAAQHTLNVVHSILAQVRS